MIGGVTRSFQIGNGGFGCGDRVVPPRADAKVSLTGQKQRNTLEGGRYQGRWKTFDVDAVLRE